EEISGILPILWFSVTFHGPGYLTPAANIREASRTSQFINFLNEAGNGCLARAGWKPEFIDSRHPHHGRNSVVRQQDSILRQAAADGVAVPGKPTCAIALEDCADCGCITGRN